MRSKVLLQAPSGDLRSPGASVRTESNRATVSGAQDQRPRTHTRRPGRAPLGTSVNLSPPIAGGRPGTAQGSNRRSRQSWAAPASGEGDALSTIVALARNVTSARPCKDGASEAVVPAAGHGELLALEFRGCRGRRTIGHPPQELVVVQRGPASAYWWAERWATATTWAGGRAGGRQGRVALAHREEPAAGHWSEDWCGDVVLRGHVASWPGLGRTARRHGIVSLSPGAVLGRGCRFGTHCALLERRWSLPALEAPSGGSGAARRVPLGHARRWPLLAPQIRPSPGPDTVRPQIRSPSRRARRPPPPATTDGLCRTP